MAYVLVVDDEESIREAAAIILCDVMMPGQDGLWLAEQVRERWPQTAILMASSAQDMDTVTRMRNQGAVDYVTKPFGREMLRQALQRASQFSGV